MSGSGMPVTGMMPIVMPTLTSTWKASIEVMPVASRRPNVSPASRAVTTPRQSTMRYKSSRNVTPMKPSSSPTTAKMKSVWFSGKKFSWLCVPPKSPLPNSMPEPMAILDWMMW